jgi:hypothetical protein
LKYNSKKERTFFGIVHIEQEPEKELWYAATVVVAVFHLMPGAGMRLFHVGPLFAGKRSRFPRSIGPG